MVAERAGGVSGGSGEGALVAAIAEADAAHALFAPDSVVLVAVSGGPDSVALLDALLAYAPERRLTLHVAHLDHRLRGSSVDDAAFVEGLAEDLGLPITLDARDVRPVAAREGRGIEDAARVVRYAWLAMVAARVGAATVATGHHADDQAETVVANLIRGAGLDGLSAMRARSPWPIAAAEVEAHEGPLPRVGDTLPVLARPLLAVRRTAILEHLSTRRLAHRVDPSNTDVSRVRNRLRHEIMPVLRAINPALAETLGRSAASIADDAAALEAALDAVWPELDASPNDPGADARPEPDPARGSTEADRRIALARMALAALHPALQRRAVRRALARIGAEGSALGWEHVETIRRAAIEPADAAGTRARPFDLPGGLRAIVLADTIEFGRQRRAIPPPGLSSALVALPEGETTALPGGWRVSVQGDADPAAARSGGRDPWTAHLDADALPGPLAARGRMEGDRFQPSGMDGRSKSIQDFFVDLKVPVAERGGWPLIVSGERIVWVPGHRVDERAKVTSETRRVLVVRAQPPARLR